MLPCMAISEIHMTILKKRTNLIIVNIFVVSLALLFGILLHLGQMRGEALRQVQETQDIAIRTFWKMLIAKGGDLRIADNRLMAGDYLLNGSTEIPDKISELFGCTAAIFMGDTQVASNETAAGGSSRVETKLTAPAYEAIFTRHGNYRGEALIAGTTHFAAYDPIHDASGNIIGVLFVGIKKGNFLADYGRLVVKSVFGALVLEILLVTLVWGLFRERGRSEEELRKLAEQMKLITDSVPVAIAYVDAQLRYLFANKSYGMLFGFNHESLIGKTMDEILTGWEFPDRSVNIRHVLRGERISFSSRVARENGQAIYLETSYIPHRLADGKVTGFFIQHHDITGLALAEEEIRRSEERYRTMFNTTGSGTMVIEADGTISLVNDEGCRLTGYRREEIEGGNWSRLIAPHDLERLQEYDRQRGIDPNLPPSQYECDVIRADGSIRTGIVHVGNIPGTGQTIVSFLDITERKELELAVNRQLDFLQTLIDTIPSPIFYKDRQGRYTGCNRAFEEYLGLSREELLGKTVHDLAPRELADRYREMDDELLNNPGTQRYEAPVMYADGSRHDIVFYKATFRDRDGQLQGLVGMMLDITERKRMEDALISAEAQFRSLVEQSLVGIYIIQESRFAYVNPKMCEIFGYTQEELTGGITHLELTDEKDREMSAEHVRRRIDGEIESIHYEFDGKRKDGTRNRIEVFGSSTIFNGKPAVIGTLLDITERKRIEDELRRSEERYRTVFETAGSAMLIIEADTTISLVNGCFCELTGYSREEVEGRMSWVDVVTTADRERMLGYHRSRRTDPESAPPSYEFRMVNRSGEVRDILTSVAMIPGTGQSVQSYLDITELKQSERLLAGEKDILESIVAGAPLSNTLNSLCRNIEEQSFGALCSILLVNDDGTHLRHAAAPSLPEEYNSIIDGTRIGMDIGSCGTAAFTREQVIVSDISTDPRWAKYRKLPLSFGLRACWSNPIFTARGDLLGTFAVYYTQVRSPREQELLLIERAAHLASIVIERHRATEKLQQMQIQQRAILDNIPDLVWLKDRESRFITVNKAFAAASGLLPDQVGGMTDNALYPEDLAAKYRQDDYSVMISRTQVRTEELFAGNDNRRRWIETIKMPVYDNDGELIGTTGIARDIDERKRAEAALRESEERFHNIFDQSDDAIILFQLDTFAIIDANPAALKLFGIPASNMDSIRPYHLIDRADFEKLIDELGKDSGATTFQLDRARGIRGNGTHLTIVIRANILNLKSEYVVHCSIRDISEKLRLEEEVRATQAKLIQANKMTSLGMLSSSVAHEINNPNNCISVNSSMLEDIWCDAEPILIRHMEESGDFPLRGLPFSRMQAMVPRLIHGISEGSRRISAIVQNMRDYVKEGKGAQKSPVDLNRLVENATAILWHHIHNHTENFSVSLQEELPPVLGHGQQIEQVIINLLMNALQALPEKGRGVRIATVYEGKEEKVTVKVEDEGVGMEQEIIDRLSEPFFTTRSDSGGTGLGIYISSSIIKEHEGTMEFASEPGKGTTVTVTLPLAS